MTDVKIVPRMLCSDDAAKPIPRFYAALSIITFVMWENFTFFSPQRSVEGVQRKELLFAQENFREVTGNEWAKFSEGSVEKVAEYRNLDESLSLYF